VQLAGARTEPYRLIEIERQILRVKGAREPLSIQLRYTVHGPIIREEAARHRAYALRWVGTEPGTAGYERLFGWMGEEARTTWARGMDFTNGVTPSYRGWFSAWLPSVGCRRGKARTIATRSPCMETR